MNSGEQVALTNLFTQSESFVVSDIVKSRISDIALIDKITGSLRKRASDLIRRGVGLENLSYDEIDLIAKTIKKERNIDIYRSGDLSKVNVKFTDNSKHMFREDEGHRLDSPEFRAEIMMTLKNVKNYHGSDVNNNDWYSEMLFDGTQRWVSVYQGIIKNCGINNIPKTYNPITGLSGLACVKK